jgi:hypothetical protein
MTWVIKLRAIRWAGYVARMETINAYRVLVGRPQGTRPFARPRCGWKYNIKIDVKQDGMAWTGLIWLGIGTGGGLL